MDKLGKDLTKQLTDSQMKAVYKNLLNLPNPPINSTQWIYRTLLQALTDNASGRLIVLAKSNRHRWAPFYGEAIHELAIEANRRDPRFDVTQFIGSCAIP